MGGSRPQLRPVWEEARLQGAGGGGQGCCFPAGEPASILHPAAWRRGAQERTDTHQPTTTGSGRQATQ